MFLKWKTPAVGLFCASAALALSPASAQELRFATVASPGGIDYEFSELLVEQVQERTDGRVTITIFPGGQLGTIAEMISGVSSGAIDMTLHDFASLAPYVEDVAVLSAPYIYDDGAAALKVLDPAESPIIEEFNQKLVETGNIRIVGALYRGARQLTANFPVHSPADLEGQKVRIVPLPLWETMLEGMGAIPTPVEFAELQAALATGLVAGQENPLQGIHANKIYEVQPYVMLTAHMQSVLGVFINEDSWQSISEDDRATFEEIVQELAQWSLERTTGVEEEIKADLQAQGVTVIGPEDGLEVEAFREGVLAQLAEDFPEWNDYVQQIRSMQ